MCSDSPMLAPYHTMCAGYTRTGPSHPATFACAQKFVLCFVNFFLAANLFSFTFLHCPGQRCPLTHFPIFKSTFVWVCWGIRKQRAGFGSLEIGKKRCQRRSRAMWRLQEDVAIASATLSRTPEH